VAELSHLVLTGQVGHLESGEDIYPNPNGWGRV
jgi:hypothetical protein